MRIQLKVNLIYRFFKIVIANGIKKYNISIKWSMKCFGRHYDELIF